MGILVPEDREQLIDVALLRGQRGASGVRLVAYGQRVAKRQVELRALVYGGRSRCGHRGHGRGRRQRDR